jgi:hypothetical protein
MSSEDEAGSFYGQRAKSLAQGWRVSIIALSARLTLKARGGVGPPTHRRNEDAGEQGN